MTTEGKRVAVAFDGPTLDEDQLLDFIEARNREDKDRSSSAGESRERIGAFIDSTGINSKALAWLRQLMKINDKPNGQAKAMDIIMSFKAGLVFVEAAIRGQGTQEMDFDADDAPEPDPIDDEFANDAFGAGQHAYQIGVPRHGNPFSDQSERIHHNLWSQGWDKAADDEASGLDGEFEMVGNVVTPFNG